MNSTLPSNSTAPSEATGTNADFSHTVQTKARPEAVWRLWTEVSTWPSWDSELESVRLEVPFGAGASGMLKGKGAPESAFVIDDVVPGASYRFSTKLPFGGALVIDRTLTPLPEGTRFEHHVRFQGFGGWLLSGFLGGGYRKALPGVMEKIRVLAEASP
jgi:uncharacterized protein YndB with AHSA1/START domain